MKHIFLVHTPITYLGALRIIQHLNIEKNDAIFLFQSFRPNIEINEHYKGIQIDGHYAGSNFLKKALKRTVNFSITAKFDKLITKVSEGETFTAYIPVVTFIHKLLITHKYCVRFNFFEEGLAQYYKEETLESINAAYSKLSWRVSISGHFKNTLRDMYLMARGYNLKLMALPFSYSCYHAVKHVYFYGYSADAFPLVENGRRIIIPLHTDDFSFIPKNPKLILDNSFIWIGDPGVVHYGYDKEVYLQGIRNGCISLLKKKNINRIFIKFHRDEPAVLRKEIEAVFELYKIQVIIIPDTEILELYLPGAVNVTLIGVYSSLLYYAAIMGQASYSVFNYVKHEYGRGIANRDFSFFWQKVKLLEEENTAY